MLQDFLKAENDKRLHGLKTLLYMRDDVYEPQVDPIYNKRKFDLLTWAMKILYKVDLKPDVVVVNQNRGTDCVELRYEISDKVELHFNLQPHHYTHHIFKYDPIEPERILYNGSDVPTWINTLTKDLLDKKMKEYNC